MKKSLAFLIVICLLMTLAGCQNVSGSAAAGTADTISTSENNSGAADHFLSVTSEIAELESGFSAVRYDGDNGFDLFLEQGGADSDQAVLQFLDRNIFGGNSGLQMCGDAFGCSTVSVKNADGGYLFGRNFDWQTCDALVVVSYPREGYASVSTVNLGFIRQGAGSSANMPTDEMLTVAALYAPLDGMNEKGLCVSVNMIRDNATIRQDTGKADITTTTAIRLMLDKAATAEEALELLRQYDLHASFGTMVHFAIADSTGNSVAVEYIDDEIVVIETPVLTNFYLAEGKKQGIGTSQSHTRFEILEKTLEEHPSMTAQQVRDALDGVSKDNFGEFESTEWSIVFDQSALTATYYHRENYEAGYAFQINHERSGAFDAAEKPPAPSNTAQPLETQSESSVTGEESNMFKIEVLIGNETYTATLYENETTKALMEMLPLTLDMSELNGNEKYHYLDTGLPANADKPSGIKAGDLMLFGDRCLVLFYESFSTSYTYTPLGRMDDPAGLAAALGSGDVQVTFRKG